MMLSFIRRRGRGVVKERILCVRLVNFRRALSFSRLVRFLWSEFIDVEGVRKYLWNRGKRNAGYFKRKNNFSRT